jgi:hypothetical protein
MVSFVVKKILKDNIKMTDPKTVISEQIIAMHNLARQIEHYQTSFAIRKLADDLARVGNEYYDYEQRNKALDEMVKVSEELGLYDEIKSSGSNTDNR